ncbi:hypothetical protein [Aliiglaciecola sp. M165]|uniref:hypothetical protein n=1 Tax=Aliiglaciecola sp. M165 TaxID=2593649 RepID=UPI00163DDFF1|nr:hypothetical protein [Aliiglaciecola sp. M165]
MKTKTVTKAIILSLFLSTAVVATAAQAGSKQKPKVAEVQIAWYQPVLDFFNF